jgi:hypothetical protein
MGFPKGRMQFSPLVTHANLLRVERNQIGKNSVAQATEFFILKAAAH